MKYLILIALVFSLGTVAYAENIEQQTDIQLKELKQHQEVQEVIKEKTNLLQLEKEKRKDVESEKQELIKQYESEIKDLRKRVEARQERERLARVQREQQQQQTAQRASHTGSGSCEAEIAKYDWNHSVATQVMYAESGGRPGVVNDNPATGDYSVGCFQVNLFGAIALYRPSEAELKIASNNVKWAYDNYVRNGRSFIGQWGVCRSMVNCY